MLVISECWPKNVMISDFWDKNTRKWNDAF